MAYNRKEFLSVMLLVTGIALLGSSLVLVNYFFRALRPVIVMGPSVGLGGVLLESAVLACLLLSFLSLGTALIILYAKNARKSRKKGQAK